jgi:hypothetical protein
MIGDYSAMKRMRRIIIALMLGSASPETFAQNPVPKMDLGLICDADTPADDKSILPANVPESPYESMCVRTSTLLRDVDVGPIKLRLDSAADTWWLTIDIPDATVFYLDSLAAKHGFNQLALMKRGTIVSAPLIVKGPTRPELKISASDESGARRLAHLLHEP